MRLRKWTVSIGLVLCLACETSPPPPSAIAGLETSATQGDAEAQLALGLAYKAGDGITQDEALALQWIGRAARQGLPEAESQIAFAFQRGEGVEKSDEQAIEWHKRAANHGVVPSMRALGQYLTRNPIDPRPVAGVNWLREAAQAGDREAQALLGEVL